MLRISSSLLGLIAVAVLLVTGCDKPAPVTTSLDGYQVTDLDGGVSKAVIMEGSVLAGDGYLLNDVKHGLWTTYHPDGRIKTLDHYINGRLHGVSLVFDNRGQITNKAFYKADVYDGQKVTYRFGRAQEVIPYANGTIHGQVLKYYTNGKVMESNDFVDGKQHGYYRHYNENGDMDLEYVYENGEKVSGGIVTPAATQE